MDKRELQIIQQLMKELQDKMEFGESDFDERLGRRKPDVEVVKIEGEMPSDESDMEDMDVQDSISEMEDLSPEEKLKKRLMKLRE